MVFVDGIDSQLAARLRRAGLLSAEEPVIATALTGGVSSQINAERQGSWVTSSVRHWVAKLREATRRHADADTQDQCAVRDPLLEILRRAPLGVHVMREEVTGLACVGDYVSLGDRAAEPNGA